MLAFRPKPVTERIWRPLINYLNRSIPGNEFILEVFTYPELEDALAQHRLDFVITNPGHYIEIRHRHTMSGVLATLVEQSGQVELSAFGGGIVARNDRTDLNALPDLQGKTIATVGITSLGGYQAQAYELVRSGVDLPRGKRLVVTGMPHDQVVQLVLDGKADAGFVRSGVIEQLAAEHKLDLRQLKIINRQNLPDFPYAVSTPLYPEWPFIAVDHVGEDLSRQVAAILLLMKHQNTSLIGFDVHGFSIPADYSGVETVLRELRLPPFDAAPSFTFRDIWQRYRIPLVTIVFLAAIIGALAGYLLIMNQRLRLEQARVRESESRYRALIEASAQIVWQSNTRGEISEFSPSWCEYTGQDMTRKTGYDYAECFHPDDRANIMTIWKNALERGVSVYAELRLQHRSGGWRWNSVRAVPIRNAAGLVISWIGSYTDIHERKQAEDLLRENQKFLKTIFDAVPT